MYRVTHNAIPAESSATGSEIPAVTDYRYYGANPNNYICLDMEGQSTCSDKHLYRIIGSIYEENAGTNLLKVIKATPLTDGTTSVFSWDCGVTNQGLLYFNNWSTSSLDILLSKWFSGKASKYYNGSTTAISVDFTNYSPSDKAKQFINNSKWYLGGHSTSTGVTTEQFYTFERGNKTYSRNFLYSNSKIGLMYPSDYEYAADFTKCKDASGNDLKMNGYNSDVNDYQCRKNNYLYKSVWNWLLTPYSGNSSNVWYVHSDGRVIQDYYAYNNYGVRPVLFLSPTQETINGNGSQTNPYQLKVS